MKKPRIFLWACIMMYARRGLCFEAYSRFENTNLTKNNYAVLCYPYKYSGV
jgi:hypothetical protein